MALKNHALVYAFRAAVRTSEPEKENRRNILVSKMRTTFATKGENLHVYSTVRILILRRVFFSGTKSMIGIKRTADFTGRAANICPLQRDSRTNFCVAK